MKSGWICINRGQQLAAPYVLAAGHLDTIDGVSQNGPLVPRGTLMFEAEIPSLIRLPTPLLSFHSTQGWTRHLSISIDRSNVIRLQVQQGQSLASTRLWGLDLRSGSKIRITYGWDAPERIGHLTVQMLDGSIPHTAEVKNPPPLPMADLDRLVNGGSGTFADPGIECLALAVGMQPICLPTGLTAGTLVRTSEGMRPVERLGLGDMVVTASGISRPIRWLAKTEVPAVGQFAPIRLHAPYFGLSSEIVVASSQGVLMTGSDAEYLFGSETVLAKASDLRQLPSVEPDTRSPVVTYHQILLDQHDFLDLGGCWVESLYVGGFHGNEEALALTDLADLPPTAFPRHRGSAARSLCSYETVSLLREMSA